MFGLNPTRAGDLICLLLAASQPVITPVFAAAVPRQPLHLNSSSSMSPTSNASDPTELRQAWEPWFQSPGSKYWAPHAMDENAVARDLQWQPYMDFDTDGCYNSVAINMYGNTAEGLAVSFADTMDPVGVSRFQDCRGKHDLDNTNAYVRRRCNRGVCAYLYGYYFPKDVGHGTGHRHDWEHVAVWTLSDKNTYQNERIMAIAASKHGGYEILAASDKKVRMEGTHVKIVYHLGRTLGFLPGGTHSFRFATAADDKIENHTGAWFRSPLLSWSRLPKGLLGLLEKPVFGDAHLGLRLDDFTRELVKSMPDFAKQHEFDCAYDEPGTNF